jgi:hypothetical protein
MGRRVALGLAVSALWAGLGAFHLQEMWPTVTRLSAQELTSLVVSRSSELALFWLVLGYVWLAIGYFQQRAESRQAASLAQRASEQAAAVSSQLEAETLRFQSYHEKRVRAAQPVWELQGCIAHKQQHEITLLNKGAPASNIRAMWDSEMPLVVALSNPGLVNRGEQLTLKIMFVGIPVETFNVRLEYCDALREKRMAHVAVEDAAVTVQHEEC